MSRNFVGALHVNLFAEILVIEKLVDIGVDVSSTKIISWMSPSGFATLINRFAHVILFERVEDKHIFQLAYRDLCFDVTKDLQENISNHKN